MQIRFMPLVMMVLFGLIQGCSSQSADELFSKGEAATHLETSYPEAEQYLATFLDEYPDDPRVDLALQALARVLLNQHKTEKAIERYEELIRRFPKSRYSDQAQFMIGYTFDQQGLMEKARAAYQKVINNFPGSDLVDDAKISIANLGKPPEAWFPADSSASGVGH
jgi:TolA-binding protein